MPLRNYSPTPTQSLIHAPLPLLAVYRPPVFRSQVIIGASAAILTLESLPGDRSTPDCSSGETRLSTNWSSSDIPHGSQPYFLWTHHSDHHHSFIYQNRVTQQSRTSLANPWISVPRCMWSCLSSPAFLPARRYASAGYRDRNVSVCPSVRPTRAGIVSKRRMLAAWFLHHLVAPRL